MLPEAVRSVLPAGTAETWERISTVVPPSSYLVGGTGLAVHLHHRISRDLDFFLSEAFDVDALATALAAHGPFLSTTSEEVSPCTLGGVFDATKVQFLEATSQRLIEAPTLVAGLRVASVADLLATKLNVITHRPALRDYVDLMQIERVGGLYVEEGLGLFVEKYEPAVPDQTLRVVVNCLASFADVDADPELTFPPGARVITKAEVAHHWARRVPEIVRHLGRFDVGEPG